MLPSDEGKFGENPMVMTNQTIDASDKPDLLVFLSDSLVVRVMLILLVSQVLEGLYMLLGRLPSDAFEQPTILGAMIRGAPGQLISKRGLLGLGVLAIILFFGSPGWWRRLPATWQARRLAGPCQALVVSPVLILGWYYAFSTYNYYFDRWHGWDRAMLLLFGALTVVRPGFILLFLLTLTPMISQYDSPIGRYSWAEQFPLLRIMFCAGAWLLLDGKRIRLRPNDLVFLVLCLIASHYWHSGIIKLRMGWATVDQVSHLIPATYSNGWLRMIGEDRMLQFKSIAEASNMVLIAFTLLVECAIVLCLWRRATAVAWLAMGILFHVGIFTFSGICFWRWALVDLVALVTLLVADKTGPCSVFTRRHFALSVVVIVSSVVWMDRHALGWYDVPLNYSYRFDAITDSGKAYPLPPHFFSPYEYQFTMGRFHGLVSGPRLPVIWGSTGDRNVMAALNDVESIDDFLEKEKALGRDYFNENEKNLLTAFIVRFIQNYNAYGPAKASRACWAPPYQLWTIPPPNAYKGREKILAVRITQVTALYYQGTYSAFRPITVLEIPIDK